MSVRIKPRYRELLVAMATAVVLVAALLSSSGPARADDPSCKQRDATGHCVVVVTGPHPGPSSGGTTGGGGGGGSAPTVCKTDVGHVVPCYSAVFGYFMLLYGMAAYVQVMKPQPPKTDPAWEGHTDGAIYQFTGIESCHCTNGGWMWMQNPPPGMAPPVDPLAEARKLRAEMTLPTPAFHRSPSENNDYRGQPFSYVNIPTWFWTDPADYQDQSKSVTLQGITITVTAAPTSLVFDSGSGDTQSCAGPGRPWSSSDGNSAAPGHCSYSYRHVSAGGPVTSSLTVNWGITWTATGAQGGTLQPLYSRSTATLNVLQVQVVDHD